MRTSAYLIKITSAQSRGLRLAVRVLLATLILAGASYAALVAQTTFRIVSLGQHESARQSLLSETATLESEYMELEHAITRDAAFAAGYVDAVVVSFVDTASLAKGDANARGFTLE